MTLCVPENKTMAVAAPSNRRPSIKVRLTIRPDDFGLLGLYLHLAQISSDLGRATALRGVLSLGISIQAPTELPENMDRLPAIAVRMTIITRDAGLEKLHDELLILPTDLQRRIHLKDKITRIQLGANDSNAALGSQMSKFEAPLPIDLPQAIEATQESAAELSPVLQKEHPAKPPQTETSSESNDQGAQTPINKNLAFKRRMRDASRVFDI